MSPILRLINAISKNMTTENTPFMGLTLIVQNVFKDLKRDNKLMLSPTKEDALNNSLSSYPTIITKDISMSSIKSGFIYNNMMDDHTYTTPEMMAILNTCKTKKYMMSAKYAVECNFKNVYEEQMSVEMLTDKHLST